MELASGLVYVGNPLASRIFADQAGGGMAGVRSGFPSCLPFYGGTDPAQLREAKLPRSSAGMGWALR